MADSFGKRSREAKKRQQREIKAERKRLRKQGLLGGNDTSGLFAPGETPREALDTSRAATPPAPSPQSPPPPQ